MNMPHLPGPMIHTSLEVSRAGLKFHIHHRWALSSKLNAPCRRIVQVEVNTTDVNVKLTQFVKRELHSLVLYLHSSFSDQALAANIARPFAQRVWHFAPVPGCHGPCTAPCTARAPAPSAVESAALPCSGIKLSPVHAACHPTSVTPKSLFCPLCASSGNSINPFKRLHTGATQVALSPAGPKAQPPLSNHKAGGGHDSQPALRPSRS